MACSKLCFHCAIKPVSSISAINSSSIIPSVIRHRRILKWTSPLPVKGGALTSFFSQVLEGCTGSSGKMFNKV